MEIFAIRIASLIVIGLIYMLFDLFNRRNIPSWFVYSAFVYGVLLTLLYFNLSIIFVSAAIAAFVFAIGYFVYRNGYLGAGDVFEFATLSLILPFQSAPLLLGVGQLGLPFIVSVFMAAGIAALIIIPIYYLPKAHIKTARIGKDITSGDAARAVLIGLVYLLFGIFLILDVGVGFIGIAVLVLLMLGSVMIMLFQRIIARSMVKYVGVSRFEEGDMIATNLMAPSAIAASTKQIKSFGRLVTPELIKEMRRKRITTKFPVYKNAVPLAAPIFIGIVAALLFGNIILFLLMP